mmetsp:Transcript_41721/g.75764  ORF Transcript_41721/g.75764 Transcript_41721/m.75764 type:complete len:333 (+) Transcript_41721:78-1076(+)
MLGKLCGLIAAVLVCIVAMMVAVLMEPPSVTTLGEPGQGPLPAGQTHEAGSSGKTSGASPDGVVGVVRGEEQAPMGSGGMFNKIAAFYDSTNKVLSFGQDQRWRSTLVQECLGLQPGDRVLDLATGTADMTLLIASELQQLAAGKAADDSVLGVDPSTQMLRIGVSKVEGQGMKGVVRLVKGDAQNLTEVQGIDAAGTLAEPTAGIATGSIDKISMAFGIRNVPDRARALREMRRVLKSSTASRVCILELSLPPGDSFLPRLARGFITGAVPVIGKVVGGGEEYEYLKESILKFPDSLAFAEQMGQSGLPVHSITSFGYGAVNIFAAAPAQR